MDDAKPHLSVTQLEMLSKCGLQYGYRYLQGIKRAPGLGLLRGKATHASIEADLGAKIATGALLPDADIPDLTAGAFRASIERDGVALTDDEVRDGERTAIDAAQDLAIRLAVHHHDNDAPILRPIAVERRWRLELRGFPRDLEGIIDIQEATAVEDTKTSTKSPSAGDADVSVQLTAYACAVKVLDGAAPAELRLRTLVGGKRDTKSVVQTTTRDDEDYRRLLLRVEHAARVIETGALMPARPTDWWCSEKFCGYWGMCPFGARQRRQA